MIEYITTEMKNPEIITDEKADLNFCQDRVGGYIEIIEFDDFQVVVNDEGLIRGLHNNSYATKFCQSHLDYDIFICGDVLILSGNDKLK